jgi:hypothetical protein
MGLGIALNLTSIWAEVGSGHHFVGRGYVRRWVHLGAGVDDPEIGGISARALALLDVAAIQARSPQAEAASTASLAIPPTAQKASRARCRSRASPTGMLLD